ncbi:transcriptional regulator, TetR family [Seinonella peptonophila]|uniref:Transcriptional regulator, TetR family n=1 Tax=Seinonella peptonophila TaxID=112248 RepID=A0A1M4X1Y5_9BACL|nr:TetR/AcrR family transcriptional regulator [Seinonella peptonophila]SHE87343.1 transcriptional regulator, TetR family [Seinonella peptonophila]
MSPRKGLDQQKVLKQATQIVNEQGFNQITIAALAKSLDVRSPSLYNHFSGLSDLQKRLALYALEQLGDSLMRSVIGKSGDIAVRALCEAYLNFARTNPGLYEAILHFPAKFDRQVEQAGDQIISIIVEVLRSYGFSQIQMIHAIRSLRSIVHGFATLEQADGFQMDVSRDESFDFLITLYIDGLHKQREDHSNKKPSKN